MSVNHDYEKPAAVCVNKDYEELVAVFAELDLAAFLPALQDFGVTNLSECAELSVPDLKEIGLSPIQINRLCQFLGKPDEVEEPTSPHSGAVKWSSFVSNVADGIVKSFTSFGNARDLEATDGARDRETSVATSHTSCSSESRSRSISRSVISHTSRKSGLLGHFERTATDAIVEELGERGQELAPRALGITDCDLAFRLDHDVRVDEFLPNVSQWADPGRWLGGVMKKNSIVLVVTKTNVANSKKTVEKLMKSRLQLAADKRNNANMILVCAANTPEELDMVKEHSKLQPEIHFLAVDVERLCPEEEEKWDWAKLRTVAGGTATGAAAGGIAGGTACGVAGVAMGGTVGLVPAMFTFGLSIPVCALLGGGIGVCTGAVTGGTVGAVSGGHLGYNKQEELEHLANTLCGHCWTLITTTKNRWTKAIVGDAPGRYLIVHDGTWVGTSPDDIKDSLGKLSVGTCVVVTQVVRTQDKVRALVEGPIPGWISLASTGKQPYRWAQADDAVGEMHNARAG